METEFGRMKLVLNENTFTNENGETYTGYGFTAYLDDPPREVYSIKDLSVDADEIRELMRLILDNDVSIMHFPDLIEDFLG